MRRMRPRVVVSRCLGFARCRYDGEMSDGTVVRALKPFVEFIPVCPEVAIGLGVPRDPIRIVRRRGAIILYQPATRQDLTSAMQSFAAQFLDSIGGVDGFILKSRSPSCGIRKVKVYSRTTGTHFTRTGRGCFTSAVRQRLRKIAMVDEIELQDDAIRRRFLERALAAARRRAGLPRRPKLRSETDPNPGSGVRGHERRPVPGADHLDRISSGQR